MPHRNCDKNSNSSSDSKNYFYHLYQLFYYNRCNVMSKNPFLLPKKIELLSNKTQITTLQNQQFWRLLKNSLECVITLLCNQQTKKILKNSKTFLFIVSFIIQAIKLVVILLFPFWNQLNQVWNNFLLFPISSANF